MTKGMGVLSDLAGALPARPPHPRRWRSLQAPRHPRLHPRPAAPAAPRQEPVQAGAAAPPSRPSHLTPPLSPPLAQAQRLRQGMRESSELAPFTPRTCACLHACTKGARSVECEDITSRWRLHRCSRLQRRVDCLLPALGAGLAHQRGCAVPEGAEGAQLTGRVCRTRDKLSYQRAIQARLTCTPFAQTPGASLHAWQDSQPYMQKSMLAQVGAAGMHDAYMHGQTITVGFK